MASSTRRDFLLLWTKLLSVVAMRRAVEVAPRSAAVEREVFGDVALSVGPRGRRVVKPADRLLERWLPNREAAQLDAGLEEFRKESLRFGTREDIGTAIRGNRVYIGTRRRT